MINPRISADWSTTKRIAAFSCTSRVQEVDTKAEFVHLTPWSPRLRGIIQLSRIGNVLRNMINPRISADWSTTKRIAAFSCTSRVQEVDTKAEFVHLTPWSPRLRGIIQLSRIGNVLRNMINPRISAEWSTTKPIAAFSCTSRVQEVHTKAEVVHLTPGLLGLGVLLNCHA